MDFHKSAPSILLLYDCTHIIGMCHPDVVEVISTVVCKMIFKKFVRFLIPFKFMSGYTYKNTHLILSNEDKTIVCLICTQKNRFELGLMSGSCAQSLVLSHFQTPY